MNQTPPPDTEKIVNSICKTLRETGMSNYDVNLAVEINCGLAASIIDRCKSGGVTEPGRQWKILGAALFVCLASYEHAHGVHYAGVGDGKD